MDKGHALSSENHEEHGAKQSKQDRLNMQQMAQAFKAS